MSERALSFDVVADQYDAARPGYPPALFDAIEDVTGRPIAGSDVIDVGAGTGISTRLLLDRGARVTAVEPGPGMAARLHHVLPDVSLIRGIGDALPLVDGSADLIPYAQSWHWTDSTRSLPEALRVLRPGGALALWWNISDSDVPWVAAQGARIRARGGDGAHGATTRRPVAEGGRAFTERMVRWTRTVPLDTHLANLGSHSVFRLLGETVTAEFLTAERAELLKVFPDGMVEEPYAVDLAVTVSGRR
jgi:SAM-dependent methyltransferase